MRRLLLIIATAALAGCAAPRQESPADQALSTWVGRPIDAVIAAWGAPTAEDRDGPRHLYFWEASHYGRRYQPANLPTGGPAPYGDLPCRAAFEVDEAGTVTTADWQGYECRFLP